MDENQQATNIHIIKSFLKNIQLINDSYEKVANATGENFNIFSVLKIETDEVRTHSRFIAELLNPNGSHSQGTCFLELFLNQFDIQFELNKVEIKVEYPIGRISKDYLSGGRIDILITNQKKQVVMIENKIYANDQPNQLIRYRNYAKGDLIYLTLWGETSEDDPLKETEYKTASYAKDVVQWLEACKKETVNLPILRETIGQYIHLIKKITHQNLNQTMNKEIIDTILSSSENLNVWRELCDNTIQKEVKRRLIEGVATMIINHYTNNEEFTVVNKMEIKRIDVSSGRSLLIALQNERLKKYGLCIRFNFEQAPYYHLIIGLFAQDEMGKDRLGEKYEYLLQNIPDAKTSKLYPVYIVFDEYKDWWTGTLNKINFDFDAFIKTADEKIKKFLYALK